MGIRFYQRISVKLARWSVTLAFALGIIISLSQVYVDYRQQSALVEQKVDEIFAVTKDTATRAVYQLDADLANEVIEGLKNIHYLERIQLLDDRGNYLGTGTQQIAPSSTQAITEFFTQSQQRFELALNNQYEGFLGTLVIDVNTDAALAGFYDRATSVFVSGVLRNFILAIILILFFHFVLTGPFTRLARKFQEIDPHQLTSYALPHEPGHQKDEIGYIVDSANKMMAEIVELNTNLEQKVQTRTSELAKRSIELEQSNQRLEATLKELKQSQQELVQKEKMASLGQLVAGVAHEINTPIGVSITASSFLTSSLDDIYTRYQQEKLTEEDLTKFMEQANEGLVMLDNNLRRAADLIRSFKKIAVDRSSESIQTINLGHYCREVVNSLQPELMKHPHKIHVSSGDFELNTNPGAIAQILTNLIFNSILHAFEGGEQGNIYINTKLINGQVYLEYHDDGKGMHQDALDSIFEPFYTTARHKGGTGLGTHVVYNLVTEVLNGSINADSKEGEGLGFSIKFPQNMQEQAQVANG